MNKVVHAGLFHWKKYWLIPQVCLLLTCHPEGVLFWGESVKVNGRGKGTTKREAGSPDHRLASFLNK